MKDCYLKFNKNQRIVIESFYLPHSKNFDFLQTRAFVLLMRSFGSYPGDYFSNNSVIHFCNLTDRFDDFILQHSIDSPEADKVYSDLSAQCYGYY